MEYYKGENRMKNALVLIHWNYCPRNELLRFRIEDYLKANGWLIVPPSKIKSCKLIVFCTCGLTYEEQTRSFDIIRGVYERTASLHDPPMFVVTGCLPPINQKELLQVHKGPAVGVRDIDALDTLINATIKIADIPQRNQVINAERPRVVVERRKYVPIMKLIHLAKKVNTSVSQPYLKTFRKYLPFDMDDALFDYYQMGDATWSVITSVGCLGNCSFCSTRFAKGRIKSRPLPDIIEEVRQGIQLDYKWVALIADDNGAYGRDIGTNFAALIRELNTIEEDFNILIDSLGPNDLIKAFDELRQVFMSGKIKRICLTIQHVNPRILSSMNRSYDVDLFKEYLRTITATFPELILDFHLMICFPGETDEEFEELLEFIHWISELNPLNSFKVFTFSGCPGTVAYELDGQIPRSIMRKRLSKVNKTRLKHTYKLHHERIKIMPKPFLSKLAYLGFRPIAKLDRAVETITWKFFYRD